MKYLFTNLLLVFCFHLTGQTTFQKVYGGSSSLVTNYCAFQTSDSGFVFTGDIDSVGAGNKDIYLVKVDKTGDTLWTRTFGGAKADVARAIKQTQDKGYIIVGSTYSFGAGANDVFVIRTDSKGDTLWTKTYGGSSFDQGSSIEQTTDGGFIIAGSTSSFGTGGDDIYLIRTNSTGDTLWTRTYGGTNHDEANTVLQTADGGFIALGWTLSFGAGASDVYLIKTDGNGNLIWSKTYGGANGDGGNNISIAPDGGYIIAGWGNDNDIYLIKIDVSGNVQWSKNI